MGEVKFKFENLEIWQLSMDLVKHIYILTKRFPVIEQYALTSQLRRAAISVPLNIAEGSGRKTKKDFANFLRNAIGSTLEVITCLKIALQEKYISSEIYKDISLKAQELYFKLIAFEKSLLR